MNILLVDDEPRVLAGLERVLSTNAPAEWNVFTAGSGERAIEVMAGDPIDVVVSDMRMPGMDGAELLRTIYDRWPAAVRVILSGHADQRAALRVAEIAHQFLDKPCDSDRLLAILGRIEGARAMLGAETLSALGKVGALPPAPSIYQELTGLLEDDKAGPDRVVAVIRRDPGLVATLLKLVNSGFFGRGQITGDLTVAVRRLGLIVIRAVALDVILRASSSASPVLERNRSHGMMVGHLAESLAPASARENAFVAGILHDIGARTLTPTINESTRRIRCLVDGGELTHRDAERAVLGASHGDVGAYLLTLWGFSAAISRTVARHHDVFTEDDLPDAATAAVAVAEALVERRPPDPVCVRSLGHAEPPAQWQERLAELEAP